MRHTPEIPHERPRDRTLYAYAVIGVVVFGLVVFAWLAWKFETLDRSFQNSILKSIFTIPLVIASVAVIYFGVLGWRWLGLSGSISKLMAIMHTMAEKRQGARATNLHIAINEAPTVNPPNVIEGEVVDDIPALPLIAAGQSRLEQLRNMGHICRSGNSLLVGYAEGRPSYIELPECGFIGVGGQPRVGKSSTSLLLIEQAILSDWHVFVADPHVQKADGLLSRCKPFSGRLAKQAVTPDEISTMIHLVDKIGRRRVDGDPDRTPCILVIDEFSNLVWRGMLPADVLAILPSMAAEYAGVGVHGLLIAHDWSKASLGGDLGAALRRAITHRLIHRMDAGNVEFLLPKSSTAQSRAVTNLDVGRALYWGLEGAQMVAVPWVGEDDARYASGGTPERFYTPPTKKPAQIQAVAPTMPLVMTVQDQIVGVLSSRPWLSSTELAAALNIDVKVIRTEVAAMKKQLDRRETPKGSADRFAYALRSQPVNQSTAT